LSFLFRLDWEFLIPFSVAILPRIGGGGGLVKGMAAAAAAAMTGQNKRGLGFQLD
jgi:hypothetical protein